MKHFSLAMLLICCLPVAAVADISGQLLMLDSRTPHVATVVQVVKVSDTSSAEPEVVSTTLTDEDGKYRFTDLKPGRYQLDIARQTRRIGG